jgi:hypothetical protein
MNNNNFSDLPEWDEERFIDDDDEGEEWKPAPTHDACAALYNKWQEIVFLLKGFLAPFLEKDEDEEGMMEFTAGQMIGDAWQVGAKIKGSEAAGIYIVRMENAAIIRMLAQGISSSLLMYLEETGADENHVAVLRDEITAFRMLFIEWVRTFQKDEFTDEWGLFV